MHSRKPVVTIAVSYNAKRGGAASNSIRELIQQSGAIQRDVDYYQIVPLQDDISDIYSNSEKMQAVLTQAKERAKAYLEDVDCLILPGNGAIVDPRLYEAVLVEKDKPPVDLSRAIAEMALAHVALQKGMPILAICGGHQILNVYLGGKLVDVADDSADGYLTYAAVQFAAESELKQVMFPPTARGLGVVFGAHQQVVDDRHIGGKGLVMRDDLLAIVANSKNDANIEAMETKYGAPLYSLQFHPEVAMKGMYSVLTKAIAYTAPIPQAQFIAFRILAAVKEAAEAYALKKQALAKINRQDVPERVDITDSEVEAKKDNPPVNVTTTYHSIFNEVRTKPAPGQEVNRDGKRKKLS